MFDMNGMCAYLHLKVSYTKVSHWLIELQKTLTKYVRCLPRGRDGAHRLFQTERYEDHSCPTGMLLSFRGLRVQEVGLLPPPTTVAVECVFPHCSVLK